MTIYPNQRVKIKPVPGYSFDERLRCLAPNSVGKVVETWYHPAQWKQETQYIVKLDCGTFPFYEEELERV